MTTTFDVRGVRGSWALVASRDRRLRERARVGLGGAGMYCDDAPTADAALDRLETMRHDYAVVVIDTDLPGDEWSRIEGVAAVTLPAADIIRCGPRSADAAAPRGVWIAKPARPDEFARVVHALRAAAPAQ